MLSIWIMFVNLFIEWNRSNSYFHWHNDSSFYDFQIDSRWIHLISCIQLILKIIYV